MIFLCTKLTSLRLRAERRKIMEMKFTASVVMAIDAMLKLQQGMLRVWLKGQETEYGISDSRTLLSAPVWSNFAFFRKIESLSIERKRRVEPQGDEGGHWEVERDIRFFHGVQLVGRVTLRGKKYDALLPKRSHDDKTMWAISKIAYASSATKSETGRAWTPLEEYELLPTGYDLLSHMED